MEEIIPTVNLVVYLLGGMVKINKKEEFFLGGHGYTYDSKEEGKKKLAKDVATSSGYFTNNVQKNNTVVVVKDILSMAITNRESKTSVFLAGYLDVLDLIVLNKDMNNLYIITPHKIYEAIGKLKEDAIRKSENFKLGGEILTGEEKDQLADILQRLEYLQSSGRRVIIDLTSSAEGGIGIREANKQKDLAEVITQYGFSRENSISLIPRKEYENPEVEFNKLVCATRWYFQTGSEIDFYALSEGYRVYDFGKVEPDKNYYGKLTPDVTYSKLYTKEPLALLDKMYEFSKKRIENSNGYLSAGDLNNIVSKDIARLVDQVPGVPDGPKTLVSPFGVRSHNKEEPSKKMLVELISPVLMSYRIRDFLVGMDVIFNSFLKRDEENKHGYLTFYDITDRVYSKEVNGKGVTKVKLSPEYTQTLLKFDLKVEHPNAKKPVKIGLSIGYDIPDRSSCNSVDDPNVTVWCAVDTRNPKGIRYSTINQTDAFIYVHTSGCANLRVLSLSELAD